MKISVFFILIYNIISFRKDVFDRRDISEYKMKYDFSTYKIHPQYDYQNELIPIKHLISKKSYIDPFIEDPLKEQKLKLQIDKLKNSLKIDNTKDFRSKRKFFNSFILTRVRNISCLLDSINELNILKGNKLENSKENNKESVEMEKFIKVVSEDLKKFTNYLNEIN